MKIKLKIDFVKMHGLGNDFVLIEKSAEINALNLYEFAKTISNRRTGIGADQLILYSKDLVTPNVYHMSIYNQDGSSAKACGNGTRCLVKLIGEPEVLINVDGRILEATLHKDDKVTVNMGNVSFEEKWMPEESDLWKIASLYKLEPKEMICVDIGNPHLVIFNSDLSEEDKRLLGELLENNKIFPNGVNVNFARIEGKNINLKVWERGDGFTLACGSGACATFAAAKKLNFVNNAAVVHFELGDLEMLANGLSVLMTGPATLVAKGTYVYS